MPQMIRMNCLTKFQEAKMKRNIVKQFSLLLLMFFAFSMSSYGQTFKVPEKPSFIPPVIDSTKTLSEQEYRQLYEKVKNYSDSTSTEILVMIVNTTQGEDVWKYAFDIGDKWGIGQKGKDNGIVMLVALGDRKVAIQTGPGLQHVLTDAATKLIIENEIVPEFKQQNYYAGIDKATTAIAQVLKGEYKNDKGSGDGAGAGIIVFLIIGFIILIAVLSRRGGGGGHGGRRRGFDGSDLADIIILSSLGRGFGGGGGGSSGGGFGGFGGFGGGGGFNGGGASGSW